MIYSIYDAATGLFTGGRCTFGLLLPHGHERIKGEFDPRSQRVDISAQPPPPVLDESGRDISPPWYPPVVDYQPPAPADDSLKTWAWDTGTKRWISSPTLAAIKLAAAAALKAAAAANAQADITLQSTTFAADPATRDELMREVTVALAAQMDAQAYSLDWERSDGTAVTLTAAQLKALVRALRTRDANIRAQLRSLKTQLVAAATQAAIDAIVWTTI